MSQSAEQSLVQSFRIIKNEFERLEEHIIGNPQYGNPGIIGKIKIHEDKINDLEKEIDVYSKKIDKLSNDNFRQKVVGTSIATGVGVAAGISGKAILAKLATFFTMLKP